LANSTRRGQRPAGVAPELAGDQVAGDGGVAAEDIHHHRVEAPRRAGHEAAGVVHDEVAADRALRKRASAMARISGSMST
jgi:hypothetical protein